MIESSSTAAKTGATAFAGAAGTSYTYFGLPMADLVGLATIVYLVSQTIPNLRRLLADLWRWLARKVSP